MNSSKQRTEQAAVKEDSTSYQGSSSSRLFAVSATPATYGACSIPTLPPRREFSLCKEEKAMTVRAGARK